MVFEKYCFRVRFKAAFLNFLGVVWTGVKDLLKKPSDSGLMEAIFVLSMKL